MMRNTIWKTLATGLVSNHLHAVVFGETSRFATLRRTTCIHVCKWLVADLLHAVAEYQASHDESQSQPFSDALTELYRGQCNCSYWHGAFGGVYLPHLRHAIYNHLIAADNLIDDQAGRGLGEGAQQWVELDTEDYNLDARNEVRLASNRLVTFLYAEQRR